MARHAYPGPRAPDYDRPTSVEDCLPTARLMVEKEHGRAALGPVEAGDRLLIVTLPDQDEYVAGAITQALEDAGASEVTFKSAADFVDGDLSTYTAEEGWREMQMLLDGKASTAIDNIDLVTGEIMPDVVQYVEDHPEYTGVYVDIGARAQKRTELGDRFAGNWLFNNWEEFVSGVWSYPDDLLDAIEKKSLENLHRAEAIRITDPEGTHLEFDLGVDEAHRWARGAHVTGHLYLDTFGATILDEHEPVIPQPDGVVAGCSNHTGFFPRIEMEFEDGRLTDVRGGGKYGDLIRDFMADHEDLRWPGYPGDGFFWCVEAALGTLPRAFRRESDLFESYWQYPNISERNASGVFHHGIGSGDRTHPDAVEAYALEHDIPAGHIHVHNFFSTFEIKLRDTGTWEKIVDKGRITAMDDPAIRAKAAEFGDPDELLRDDWIPPIPGINTEGDYLEDYAPDPAGYLKDRMENGETI
jgi:hypothetical protein